MGIFDMQEKERISDVSDRATDEECEATAEALRRTLARAKVDNPAPTEDGMCACGCGTEVHPARLAIGLGMAIACAERAEALAKRYAR